MDDGRTAMMDLEAVIFDYGAVLCYPPSDGEMGEFAALAGMPDAEFRQLYGKSRGPYDRGVISADQYWRTFGRAVGVTYNDAQVRALHAMDLRVWRRMDQRMIDLAARLQKAGVRTAILSNMQTDLREILRSEAEWLRHFDVHIFSCDLKLIKPEPEIYQRVLEALGVPPQRAFFIDDIPVNIEAARQAGIGGMVYRSFDELSDRLAPLIARCTGNGRRTAQETSVVQPTAHCD
jgi:putative hydrolase of the HAD superfamily